MNSVLSILVRKENVTSIYRTRYTNYRDLHCYDILYQKGEDSYRARSFSNGIWYAPTPYGVVSPVGQPIFFKADTLSDIATIEPIESVSAMRKLKAATDRQLALFYRSLDRTATTVAETVLKQSEFDLLSSHFTMTPMASVLANLGKGGEYYGTISIDMQGNTAVVSRSRPFDLKEYPLALMSAFASVRSEVQCPLE